MDEHVSAYVEAIDPAHRPLFDRLHRLILDVRPEAEVVLSYKMPTYKVGSRRLHVATWKHGISIYGWSTDNDGGFASRHPDLVSGKGTIQLRPADGESITDDELRALVAGVLGTA